MTTEETELTFVRCPSCRSLVPAVATRCRMCGHAFEAQAEDSDEASEAPRQKSRVRQRTMSVSREDVDVATSEPEEFLNSLPEQQEEVEELPFVDRFSGDADVAQDSSVAEPTAPEFDPMAELFSDSPAPVAEQTEETVTFNDPLADIAPEPEQSQEFSDPAADDAESTLFGAPAFEQAVEPTPEESPAEAEPFAEPPPEEKESENQPEADVEALNGDEAPAGEGVKKKRKRRRRRRKRSDANELNAGGEQAAEQNEHNAVDVQAAEQKEPDVVDVQAAEQKEESPAGDLEIAESERENISEEPEPVRGQEAMAMQESNVEENSSGQRSAPQAASSNAGGLVGWLVTYGPEENGSSVELRGGRFFIGRQKLREHDMVIGDSALSTPHCLVSAAPESGIQIQDLMSEQGTFIQKAGSGSFEKIEDVASVGHGDRLRFGAYEVLVCLVP